MLASGYRSQLDCARTSLASCIRVPASAGLFLCRSSQSASWYYPTDGGRRGSADARTTSVEPTPFSCSLGNHVSGKCAAPAASNRKGLAPFLRGGRKRKGRALALRVELLPSRGKRGYAG